MKNRLILLTLATSSLVLAAFIFPLALLSRSTAAEHAADDAATQAQTTASLITTLNRPELLAVIGSSPRPVTVFLPDGTAVGQPAPLDDAVRLAATGRSITVASPGGREVLVAVAGLPQGTAVVRTFVPDSELSRGVTRTWIILGAVAVSLLGVSAAVAAALARTIVKPLARLVAVADAMAAGDLTVHSADEGPPEVRRVGRALDRLTLRITELLQHERETLADVSHRLRTPLTALRIDAETLQNPTDSARIVHGLDDLERAVTDFIRTARTQRSDTLAVSEPADASAVVRERSEFWSTLADDQGRLMRVDVPARPLWIAAAAEDLSECVDILLDNVFTHTEEGTPFTVRLAEGPAGGATLTIADSGPGFPDLSAAERGVSSRSRSTGLGLDIVTRTAKRTGGTLTLTATPSGGAAVVVEFGPPAAADGPYRRRGGLGHRAVRRRDGRRLNLR